MSVPLGSSSFCRTFGSVNYNTVGEMQCVGDCELSKLYQPTCQSGTQSSYFFHILTYYFLFVSVLQVQDRQPVVSWSVFFGVQYSPSDALPTTFPCSNLLDWMCQRYSPEFNGTHYITPIQTCEEGHKESIFSSFDLID